METLKRIAKEFWVPAIGAIAWTTYSLATRSSVWDLKAVINIFGPSFFLLSWATGQFFRIKKQSHVDKNLQGIEARLGGLVDRIEERTTDLLSHITGGESFCYLQVGMLNPATNEGHLVAVHQGRHPLYEVHARIVDLECFDRLLKSGAPLSMGACDTNVNIGSLIPGHAALLQPIRLGSEDLLRANVFFTARNGDVTQLIRMVKKNGQWYSATRVKREDRLLFEQIQDGFPGDLSADKDWNVTQQGALADVPAAASQRQGRG